MTAPMQMKTEMACALYLWLYMRLTAHSCRTSHNSRTHTDRCEGRREREPCWSTASLSKYPTPFPISVCLLPFSQCLSLFLLPLFPAFPTVPSTQDFFVIQSRKCNWSQICLGSCLISSLLCSRCLPSPRAWPQTASVRLMGTSRA